MVRVLTWNVNGLRSVVAQRGSLVALLDGLCAGVCPLAHS
jgi:exonuclease III